MSEGSDVEYKPTKQQLRALVVTRKGRPAGNTRTAGKADRPVRSNRGPTDYKEVIITDSEEESVSEQTEGVVDWEGVQRVIPERLWVDESDTTSTLTTRTSPCWSPGTTQQKTESILSSLIELHSNLQTATMAKPAETGVSELMKMMLEMNAARDKRDAEREEQRLEREERRERREQELREEAEQREIKLLLALKVAQPAVPQTVHLDNTKLPTMSKGEDVELFVELFETALTVGGGARE